MSLNGSGTYALPAGNPVVTGTTISSTTHNNTMSDIATAISTAIFKDGQQTVTANIPFATYRITGLGDATALQDAITAKQVQNSSTTYLASVAGTDTITGSATPTPSAYAAGQRFHFIPANTNTGATTLNVSSLGAKNVFAGGAACVGGEIVQSRPIEVEYDGTQFNILGFYANAQRPFVDTNAVVVGSADSTKKVRFEADSITTGTTRVVTVPDRDLTLCDGPTLGTEQASTSGTSIDFTSIPSWVKKITIQFVGVSTSGTSNPIVQIGDTDGVENTGYLGSSAAVTASPTVSNYTDGFGINRAAADNVMHGQVVLCMEDSTNFTWTASGIISTSNTASVVVLSGSKSLSAALDRVRITTQNGTDTFDAGDINILYE